MELDAWRQVHHDQFWNLKIDTSSYQVSVHSLLYRPGPVLCLSFQFLWDLRFEQIRASQPISGICTFFVVEKLLLTHFRLLFSLPKFSRSERINSTQGEGSLIKVLLEFWRGLLSFFPLYYIKLLLNEIYSIIHKKEKT
jgi:hypothetical protein